MNNSEIFGYRSGTHIQILTPAESAFVSIVWSDHVGAQHKISANELALRWYCDMCGNYLPDDDTALAIIIAQYPAKDLDRIKRKIRKLQNHLLFEHRRIPVLSKAGTDGGYWIAETEAEAEEFKQTFRKRGLTGIVKASKGKQADAADMMMQLSFEFDDIAAAAGVPVEKSDHQAPLPAFLVDRLLERMLEAPERFEADLRRLSAKFGGVLMKRSVAGEMKRKIQELNEMAAAIG